MAEAVAVADAASSPAPAAGAAADAEAGEEKMCRYCFEGEEFGPLIAPCECKGGQRWVHEDCLLRWQRMVLVSQPTHPMFHGDELRHMTCNVCKAEFSCKPPSRHELMTSFTGPEIAALIDVGCVIGAGEEFSGELATQLASMPPSLRAQSSYEHWLSSAYLITDVEDDDGLLTFDAETQEELERLRAAVNRETLVLTHRGRKLKLTRRGALANAASDASLAVAFDAPASLPATYVFEEIDDDGQPLPRTCGDDHVAAVNLCRPLPESHGANDPRARRVLRRIYETLERSRGRAWATRCRQVEIVHHVGGPCDERDVVKCLVLGATHKGYKVVKDLGEAIFLAARLAKSCDEAAEKTTAKRPKLDEDGDDGGKGDDRLGPGQSVRLRGLTKNADLNGKRALVIRRQKERWLVRVADSEDLRVVAARPENVVVDAPRADRYPLDADGDDEESNRGKKTPPFRGRVYAFWGDARWSRTQLLGEIARGHWGMCRQSLVEIVAPPDQRRKALDSRLIFAPISAMTEESIARARNQMLPLREQARAAAAAVRDEPEPDEIGEQAEDHQEDSAHQSADPPGDQQH